MSVQWILNMMIGDLVVTEQHVSVPEPDTLTPGQVRILDGLRAGWSMVADSGLWPTQPAPVTVRFGLVAAEFDDLADVVLGAPVYLDCYAGVYDVDGITPYPSIVFSGRVADVTARPRRVPGPDGWLDGWQVDVVCADHTAALGETDVAGESPFVGVGVHSKVDTLFELAGLPIPDWSTGGNGAEQLTLDEGRVDSATLADAVDAYLRTYADGGLIFGDDSDRFDHVAYWPQGWRRGVVRSNLAADPTTGLDPVEPYRIEWISRRFTSAYFLPGPPTSTDWPGRFAYRVGPDAVEGFGVEIAPPPDDDPTFFDGSVIVDAGYVDFDATLKATKGTSPNRTVVTNNTPADLSPSWRKVVEVRRLDVSWSDVVNVRITDCHAVHQYNAEYVAEMYLYDAPTEELTPDGFTWLASRDPAWPVPYSMFPDSPRWQGASRPIAVANLPVTQSPGGWQRNWHVGVLESVEWVFSGGEFNIDFTLRPGAPRPYRVDPVPFALPGALTLDDLDVNFPTGELSFKLPLIEDLLPAQTFHDFRICRTAVVDYPDLY